MKKIILAISLLAFVGSQAQPAKANGFPIAAGVLGGLAAGTVIGASIANQPAYYAPAPTYYYPSQTYYGPATAPTYSTPAATTPPAVVYSQPAPSVVYAPPAYYAPVPVVTFGFGFGRPYYYGGHGYYGYYGHSYHRGRW